MRVKMANIGYARVSLVDQDFNGQIDQLKAASCDKVFSEKMSGKSTNGRRALQKALDTLQPGDTLIVTKLDRLARSIRDLLNLLDEIKAAGAHIRARSMIRGSIPARRTASSSCRLWAVCTSSSAN